MMKTSVVLIAETTSNFISPLQKRHRTHVVRSGKQGIEAAQSHAVSLFVLDAISLKTSGERICRQLRHAFPETSIIHLYPGKQASVTSPADMILYHPVSARALLDAIGLLTTSRQSNQVQCDAFTLDLDRRILIVRGKEIALTRKQAALVEVFLRHPNETLDRKWLMHHVWDTDYTGDTRTLNVHISSVRKALELDPKKPRHLKTVRGVGYRFEVPTNKKTDL
ncbi:MAG: winged helix-turn-helix transcriptional regulator [Anaerolineae bacterium]